MMTAKLAPRSKLTLYRAYWAAPVFAAVLSAITLEVSFCVKPHSYEPGFPAFFCFLPMAFYMAASAQLLRCLRR